MSEKYCRKCDKYVSVDKWGPDKRTKDGLKTYCRNCINLYNKEKIKSGKNYFKTYYNKNKDNLKIKKKISNKERKNKILEFLTDYLNNHPCIDCGESNIIVLEFDHLSDKKKNITDMIRRPHGLGTIKEEIDKCVVRCVNCHRRKTAREGNYYRWVYQQNKKQEP